MHFLKSQKEFLSYRDEGLYQPLVGGKNNAAEAGRPTGTKEIKQVNTTRAKEDFFSLKHIIDNFKEYNLFEAKVIEHLKKKHKKKTLSKEQMDFAHELGKNIAINESKECWNEKSLESFLKNPQIKANNDRTLKIDEIAAIHNCDHFTAALLHESRISNAEK